MLDALTMLERFLAARSDYRRRLPRPASCGRRQAALHQRQRTYQYPARLYFWLLLFNGRCFVYEIFSREWLK